MGLFSLFKSKQVNQEQEYASKLTDTKVLRKLIEFLPPSECAKVFKMSTNRKIREQAMAGFDSISVPKSDFLDAALKAADYKSGIGYDLDSGWKDVDSSLATMAKTLGIEYDSINAVKRTDFCEKIQKNVVPYLLLDAMRKDPKKAFNICAALHQKGKGFLKTSAEHGG